MVKTEFILANDLKLVRAYSPNSLFNLVPYMTVVEPKQTSSGYSASSLFEHFKTGEYCVNKVKYTGLNILYWAKVFYSSQTKEYLKATQTREPNWSSAVPIMLYMYKLQHNIEYKEWDLADPQLRFMMNENIIPFLEYDVSALVSEYEPYFKELQEQALRNSDGSLRSVTSHRLSMRTQFPEFDKLPRMLKFYITKTWLYSSPTKAMWACDFAEESSGEQFPW